MLERTNLLLLSKEATEKDRSLKTQLLLSANSQSSERLVERQCGGSKDFSLIGELILISSREISMKIPSAISIRDIFLQ